MNDGQIPWSVVAICETSQIYYLMGHHHMKGGSECPFDGPVIPSGALVEYHPISAKDMSRPHQFRSKSLARYFPRLCIVCGENLWKGDIMAADIEE